MVNPYFFKGEVLRIELERVFDISMISSLNNSNKHVFSRRLIASDFDSNENNGRTDGFAIHEIVGLFDSLISSMKENFLNLTQNIYRTPFEDDSVYIPMVDSKGLDSLHGKIFPSKITNTDSYSDCLKTIDIMKGFLDNYNLGPRVSNWTYLVTLTLDNKPIFYTTVNSMVANKVSQQDSAAYRFVLMDKLKAVPSNGMDYNKTRPISVLKIASAPLRNHFSVFPYDIEGYFIIDKIIEDSTSLKEILDKMFFQLLNGFRFSPVFEPLEFVLFVKSYSSLNDIKNVRYPSPVFLNHFLNI